MAGSELDDVTKRLQSTKVEDTYQLSFKGKGLKLDKKEDGKYSFKCLSYVLAVVAFSLYSLKITGQKLVLKHLLFYLCYKIQGVLLPNTGKYGAVRRLICGETHQRILFSVKLTSPTE